MQNTAHPEKTPVVITITGKQAEQEPIELVTTGAYYLTEAGVPTIEYEESELSGLAGCRTAITFEGPQVTLSRNGSMQNCMVFAKRQTSYSHYRVNGLDLQMSVFPTVLEYELMEKEGWLELIYQIDLGGHRATNHLSLEYRKNEV